MTILVTSTWFILTIHSSLSGRNELDAAAADAEVPISVVLAETQLSLREFKEMKEGDVLYLKMEEYARMMVDEIPVLAADIGSSGPNMAAKVVRAIEPET